MCCSCEKTLDEIPGNTPRACSAVSLQKSRNVPRSCFENPPPQICLLLAFASVAIGGTTAGAVKTVATPLQLAALVDSFAGCRGRILVFDAKPLMYVNPWEWFCGCNWLTCKRASKLCSTASSTLAMNIDFKFQ